MARVFPRSRNALPMRCLLFFSCLALAPVAAQADPARWLEDVTWLADDARQGRQTGSPELLEAADWIAQRMAEAGLQPAGDDGTWLQHFSVKGRRRLVEGNQLVVA